MAVRSQGSCGSLILIMYLHLHVHVHIYALTGLEQHYFVLYSMVYVRTCIYMYMYVFVSFLSGLELVISLCLKSDLLRNVKICL